MGCKIEKDECMNFEKGDKQVMINLINLLNVLLRNLCSIKKYGAIQNNMFGLCPIQKMVPFKKISSQIMNGLHLVDEEDRWV
jgi:hypothetical protein